MKYFLFLYSIIAFLQIGFAQPQTKIFPGLPFERAVAYRMYGEEYSMVVNDSTLYEKSVDISSGVELDSSQVNDLLHIINDKATYGGPRASCFMPHEGVVFYDKKDKVVAYLEICFLCNYLEASPLIPLLESNKISPGFNKNQKSLLRPLMKEILANSKD